MTPHEAAATIDAMVASMRQSPNQFQVSVRSVGFMAVSNGGGIGAVGIGGGGAPGIMGVASNNNVSIEQAHGVVTAELDKVLGMLSSIADDLRAQRADKASVLQRLRQIPAWVPSVIVQVARMVVEHMS